MKSASWVCISRYTFRMKLLVWLSAIAGAAGLAYWFRSWRAREAQRSRASEERFASLMAQAMVPAKPDAAPQRLLLEAAAKAGEAGEPVLSIQLYARLLARYPECAFASQARAAVEEQKKKLSKA
jgi:hypothetical protein